MRINCVFKQKTGPGLAQNRIRKYCSGPKALPCILEKKRLSRSVDFHVTLGLNVPVTVTVNDFFSHKTIMTDMEVNSMSSFTGLSRVAGLSGSV